MAKATIKASNICCEGCEGNIRTAFEPVAGVRSIQVDIPAKLVQLDYDEAAVTIDRIQAVLLEKEYTVELVAS